MSIINNHYSNYCNYLSLCPQFSSASDDIIGASTPNFYLATTSEGIPLKSLLILDFEKNDFKQALVKSFGYCLDVVYQTLSFELNLMIPWSSKKFSLYL